MKGTDSGDFRRVPTVRTVPVTWIVTPLMMIIHKTRRNTLGVMARRWRREYSTTDCPVTMKTQPTHDMTPFIIVLTCGVATLMICEAEQMRIPMVDNIIAQK